MLRHLELAEVQDQQPVVARCEADIDRPVQRRTGRQALGGPVGRVDQQQVAAELRTAGRQGHRRLVPEQRDHQSSGQRRPRRCHGELGGRNMRLEVEHRPLGRGELVMIGEQEGRLRAAGRLEPGVGHRDVSDEVGPAVPGALAHLEQQIGRVADRPTTPVVGALVDRQQPAVRQEAQPEGVAHPPGHQFQVAAVEVTAQHCRAARKPGRYALPGSGRGAERDERAGAGLRTGPAGQRVLGGGVDAGEHHVEAGNVVRLRKPPQPAEFIGIQSDDPQIGHRALREIQLPVRAGHGHVDMVVAGPGHAVDDDRPLIVRADPGDPAGTALGHVQIPLVPEQSGHRLGQAVGHELT